MILYLGWNGAASHNDLRKQFPYLVSGGMAGLALVVVGAALLVIEAVRVERTELQATVLELKAALENVGGNVATVAARPLLLTPDGAVIATCRQMLAVIRMPAGKPVRLPEDWPTRFAHLRPVRDN